MASINRRSKSIGQYLSKKVLNKCSIEDVIDATSPQLFGMWPSQVQSKLIINRYCSKLSYSIEAMIFDQSLSMHCLRNENFRNIQSKRLCFNKLTLA